MQVFRRRIAAKALGGYTASSNIVTVIEDPRASAIHNFDNRQQACKLSIRFTFKIAMIFVIIQSP